MITFSGNKAWKPSTTDEYLGKKKAEQYREDIQKLFTLDGVDILDTETTGL